MQTEICRPGLPAMAEDAGALAVMGDGGTRLGPFWVDSEGLLSLMEPGISPVFSLSWRGLTIRARLEAKNSGVAALLLLETIVGRMPSSAACGSNPAARERAFNLVQALPSHLPAEWLIWLMPDHRVCLAARTSLPSPVSATALVGELTTILLHLAPYLDVLYEAEVGLAAESAGTANT